QHRLQTHPVGGAGHVDGPVLHRLGPADVGRGADDAAHRADIRLPAALPHAHRRRWGEGVSAALLTGAGIPGLGVRDVRIAGGAVTEIGSLAPHPGERVHDLAGYLLLPALVEPHVHLDKIFSAPTAAVPGAPPLRGLS